MSWIGKVTRSPAPPSLTKEAGRGTYYDLVEHNILWKDLTASFSGSKLPAVNAPTWTNFGPATTPRVQQLAFGVNDYAQLEPFHVNHDIVPNATRAAIHVHWSTDGTDTGNVQWEFTILRALGHQQEAFSSTVVTVEAPHMGTQWGHNISEVGVADELTFTEPDELIIVITRRIAASSDENTDTVFGLTMDFHYQASFYGTPGKSANDFYTG